MQSEASIRRAASELDDALEADDRIASSPAFPRTAPSTCWAFDSVGHDGVRRWLDWVFEHLERLEFSRRHVSVDGDTFVEEFAVAALLPGGKHLHSRWAELLTYRDDLVTGLRLYFNPLDLAPALGAAGRLTSPLAVRMARRGLEPYEVIEPAVQ